MDYSKSVSPKVGNNAPRVKGHNTKNEGKNPPGGRASKEELLARMKAAAEAKKAK